MSTRDMDGSNPILNLLSDRNPQTLTITLKGPVKDVDGSEGDLAALVADASERGVLYSEDVVHEGMAKVRAGSGGDGPIVRAIQTGGRGHTNAKTTASETSTATDGAGVRVTEGTVKGHEVRAKVRGGTKAGGTAKVATKTGTDETSQVLKPMTRVERAMSNTAIATASSSTVPHVNKKRKRKVLRVGRTSAVVKAKAAGGSAKSAAMP